MSYGSSLSADGAQLSVLEKHSPHPSQLSPDSFVAKTTWLPNPHTLTDWYSQGIWTSNALVVALNQYNAPNHHIRAAFVVGPAGYRSLLPKNPVGSSLASALYYWASGRVRFCLWYCLVRLVSWPWPGTDRCSLRVCSSFLLFRFLFCSFLFFIFWPTFPLIGEHPYFGKHSD